MPNNYQATDRMVDLIDDNYRLLQVLSRFGMSLGFGNKTVAEVCQMHGVDATTFLAVINFMHSGYTQVSEDFDRLSIPALIDYLRQSHIYFLDFLFPRIRRDLSTALGGERKDAITRLIFKQLDSYIGEVSRHMRFEDMHLFPYVEGLLHGQLQESFELLATGVHNFISEFNTKQFVQAIESAGFVSPKLLRSQLPLDFAYTLYLLLRENGDAWGVNKIAIKNVVRKWFVFSVLTGRYSSSPESKMDRDIRGIMDKGVVPYFSDIQAAELGDAFWNVNLVQMLETSSNTHPSFTVYVAAQVFFNDKSLLSSTPVAHLIDNGDVHHIFPKEYLKKAGVARSLYNQVANYTYLETPVNISIGKAAPNDYFGRAVRQCQDGRIEVSNNRAERSIKPFVISRKNFLFANTTNGAQSCAVLFSLIETAKENHLDPCRYLTWVLKEAPKRSVSDPNWPQTLIPQNAPPDCR